MTTATEKLSAIGASVARTVPANSLLVACIAGSEKSIGRAALTDRPVAFNQQINAVTPHADTSPLFLYFLIKVARRHIQLAAGKGMKKIINKSTFENLVFIAPGEEYQRRFEVVAQQLIEQKHNCLEQADHLEALFSSILTCTFRNELDLRRLILDLPDGAPPAPALETLTTDVAEAKTQALFRAPEAIEAALKKLDEAVGKGEPIQWSAEYFKYRILGAHRAPFTFGDVMQKAESVFVDPPYDEIKDLIFALLSNGGGHAVLRQSFDLNIDANTKEPSGRKEIVFGPAA